ncbi:hypothetical protein A3754_14635 [Alcanivorax sp. HI0083]|nr:ankyrin repeat domain-containing protein [Alcanivorax sp. HI0083]KZZ25321.1 hypothetical protein A3754_14635 [Alcanivorax sp. HI0083]
MKPGIRKRQAEIEAYLQSLYVPLNYSQGEDEENPYTLLSIEKMDYDDSRLRQLIEEGVYLNKSLDTCDYSTIWFGIINYQSQMNGLSYDDLYEWLRFMITHGADLQKRDEFGFSCLDRAGIFKNFELFKMFVEEFKVDASYVKRCPISSFMPRTTEQEDPEKEDFSGFYKKIDYFLSLGYSPQAGLYNAVISRFTPIVRKLLEAGADPNFQNASGVTPLMWAFGQPAPNGNFWPRARGSYDTAKILLDAGADQNIKSNQKRTARSILKSQSWGEDLTRRMNELLDMYA